MSFTVRFFFDVVRRSVRADVIHVHDVYAVVPWLRRLIPKKPIMMHWHGTTLRNLRPGTVRHVDRHASQSFVSTPDLTDYAQDAVYVPNPVDMDLFVPQGRGKGTVCFLSDDATKGYVRYIAGDDVVFRDRFASPVMYRDMPQMLSNYERIVDVKFHDSNIIKGSFSLTGLQALACGLKVLRWNQDVATVFPPSNRPEVAVKSFEKHYAEAGAR